MAEKNSFMLYYEIREPLELLNDEERGKLFLAILDYSERGIIPYFTGALQMAFVFIRQSLDRSAERWADICQKRAEAGKKGGRPPKATAFDENQKNQKVFEESKKSIPQPQPVPEPVPEINNEGICTSQATHTPTIKFVPPAIADFNVFWDAYPRKVAKSAAMKAWGKIKFDDALFAKIISAVETAKKSSQWQRDEGQYIPHPATWLNGCRWNDDVENGLKAGFIYNDHFEEGESL